MFDWGLIPGEYPSTHIAGNNFLRSQEHQERYIRKVSPSYLTFHDPQDTPSLPRKQRKTPPSNELGSVKREETTSSHSTIDQSIYSGKDVNFWFTPNNFDNYQNTYGPQSTGATENSTNRTAKLESLICSNDYECNNLEAPHNIPSTNNNVIVYKRIFSVMLSSFLYSGSYVIVKSINSVGPGEVSLFQCITIFLLLVPNVIYKSEFTAVKGLSFYSTCYAVITGLSLFLRFHAIQYLSLTDAIVIMFSFHIFIPALRSIFIKEEFGVIHGVSIFLTIIAIMMVAKVPGLIAKHVFYTTICTYGILSALGSLLLGTIVFILSWKLEDTSQFTIRFHSSWIRIIVILILTGAIEKISIPSCLDQWLMIILGLLAFWAQTWLTVIVKIKMTDNLSVLHSALVICQILFWQMFFFTDIPDVFSTAGTVLLMFCMLINCNRKWLLSQPENNFVRRKFSILTW